MKRTALLALVLAGLAFNASAEAQCPRDDGTLPGSPASVTTVGQGDAEPYRTVYIDDRDFLDLDEDGDAGGLRTYIESNGEEGLQRGGESALADDVPDPYVGPTVILPPDPDRPGFPHGITLFPNGFGGECWSGGAICESIWSYDDCIEYGGEGQPAEPDLLLF